MNILWDFDGTLMDTYPSYTKMVKEASQSALQDEEIFALLKVSLAMLSVSLACLRMKSSILKSLREVWLLRTSNHSLDCERCLKRPM